MKQKKKGPRSLPLTPPSPSLRLCPGPSVCLSPAARLCRSVRLRLSLSGVREREDEKGGGREGGR